MLTENTMMKRTEIAFEELLDRNQMVICRVCRFFASTHSPYFQECYQEVVYRLWDEYRRHGLSRFRHESSESTWVYQIAFNTLYHLRVSDNRQASVVTLLGQYDLEQLSIADTSCDFPDLDFLLSRLEADEARFIQYYLDSIPYKDIARQEGLTEAAARQRMSRIIKKPHPLTHEEIHALTSSPHRGQLSARIRATRWTFGVSLLLTAACAAMLLTVPWHGRLPLLVVVVVVALLGLFVLLNSLIDLVLFAVSSRYWLPATRLRRATRLLHRRATRWQRLCRLSGTISTV